MSISRFASALPLAMILCAPAYAQSAEDNRRVLDEVIITSIPGPDRKADELIGNVSVLERDKVVQALQPSLGDLLVREPGISSSSFGPAAGRPVVRGLGAERVLVLTNGIGVIDASAASPDHAVSASGIDAERIEILRGPAALAYGGEAIGGVINVIDGLIAETPAEKPVSFDLFGASTSADDGSQFGGQAQFGGGPFNFTIMASDIRGNDVDIPGFAESSLFHELEEAEHEEEDEHEDEDHHDEEEEETFGLLENSFHESQTFGAGLSLAGDVGFIGIGVRQLNTTYGLPGHAHEHEHEEEHEDEEEHDEEDHHEEEGEESPYIDLEQTRIDFRSGLNFTNGPIRRVIASAAFVDYEHIEFEAPNEPGTVFDSEGYESRVEFDHAPIMGLEGAFGLQASSRDFEAIGEESFVPATTTDIFGVFVYESRDFENGAGIEGGLRYEHQEIDASTGVSRSEDAFSASFGAHKHFDDAWFAGAQIAYTNRAPNNVELFADGPHIATAQYEIGDADLDLETAINLEGTLRWTGQNLSLGANVFVTEFDGFIYLRPTGEEIDELDAFAFMQDDATFFGGEIYGDLALGRFGNADWTLNGSIDYVDAELDSTGAPPPLLPPVTTNIGLEGAWERLNLGANLTWALEKDDVAIDELPTDEYLQLDFSADYTVSEATASQPGVVLFAAVENATDEEIRYATSTTKDIRPLAGRNIRIGARLNY